MKRHIVLSSLVFAVVGCGGSSTTSDPVPDKPSPPTVTLPGQPNDGLAPISQSEPDASEHLSGGEVTSNVFNEDAFSQSAPTIRNEFELDAVFKSGDHLFRGTHKGLGPVFNNPTCQGCHIKDGRGEVPSNKDIAMTSMFLRISDENGQPDAIYGNQLQTFGTVAGHPTGALPKFNGALDEGLAYGEAYAFVEYETLTGQFADGESYELRNPIYKVTDLSYGPFNDTVRFSARVSPSIFGSGLLHAIPEAFITSYADPDDVDNNGISGRAVYVTEPLSEQTKLARFGYKLGAASVLQQIAGAYRGDMGVTNRINQDEPCTTNQLACIAQAGLEQDSEALGLDLSDIDLAQVEFYNRLLAVPKRRGFDSQTNTWQDDIVKGRALFFAANCNGCHVPRHKTGEAPASLLGDVDILGFKDSSTPIAALSEQVIYPYTDLLLHDMGGECAPISKENTQGGSCQIGDNCIYVQRCEGLADNRPEGSASGTEWRTAPLWGLGLVKQVNARATFLHDGRARNISEAILWHGGEAEQAKQAYLAMANSDRELLLAFLNSL